MFKQPDSQPNFASQEETILAFWQKEKIFEKSVTKNEKTGEPYVIYDGPPTANAVPPFHTMVPMSFKDLVGRYQTMRGRYVPRQAGWDTHGLPVEVQVEKKLGLKSKKDILSLEATEHDSIKKFNEICKASVFEFKQEWDRFLPRTGYWTDSEHPYITYEPEYISKAWGVFKQVWEKDLVYKGYKVLPYCYRCGTNLSAAEVAMEYQDVKDTTVYVSFPLKNQPTRSLLAWTTTPWTLSGNVALAVNPDLEYVAVRQEAGEYLLAKSRLEILHGDYEILEEMKGSQLAGLEYEPIFPGLFDDLPQKKHLVLSASFVTADDGTGIVHIAPMYGEEDFNLGIKENLPQRHTVDLEGNFLAGEFAGQNIREALVPILQSLTAKNRLYAKQGITHSYPFCWRCKTPLVYYAKDSWFIAMSRQREELVKNNQTVRWIPEHIGEGRFGEFIREARDWAVSRERFWGIPIPIWISESGKQLCIGSLEELRQLAPDQVGLEFDPHRPMVDDIIFIKDGEEYRREPFVLDVWFDSGAMPYASGREEKGLFPADYIAEAVDQTRGWFYSLQALSTVIKDQSPYRRVVCIGHLVDEHGKKMSKSVGNILDPWEMFKVCGADALRWWIYTVNSPGESKALSVKELQTSFRKGLLLYWNVFNYFVTYANLAGFKPSPERGNYKNPTLLDKWIISQQAGVHKKLTAYLDDYDFMRAGRLLEDYMGDLSTWYLRRSRKRDDATFFAVLYDVLLNLATMLAPFTPFLSEHIYQTLRRADMPESVHLLDWPVLSGSDEKLDGDMTVVRQAVELGLSLRAGQQIKVRQPLATAYVRTDHALETELLDILADELNVLEIKRVTTFDENLAIKEMEGLAVALDIHLSDELIQAGLARDLLRHIQQLRKQSGLMPGQSATLVVDPSARAVVEVLFSDQMQLDTSLSEILWEPVSGDPIADLNGPLLMELRF